MIHPSQRPLCPLSAAWESCFSPGPATLARPLSYRGEQARPPITSRGHSGALCAWALRLPGAGRRRAPRRPGEGSNQVETSTGECLGNPKGSSLPSVSPGRSPRSLLGCYHQPPGRKGREPGQCVPTSWMRASRQLRHLSSVPGRSPCDKAQASCLPNQPGVACEFSI